MLRALHVHDYFRNTKVHKKGPSQPPRNNIFKKYLNFWSADVLHNKVGIILKMKKVNQNDQINKGDEMTALILLHELSYLGKEKKMNMVRTFLIA